MNPKRQILIIVSFSLITLLVVGAYLLVGSSQQPQYSCGAVCVVTLWSATLNGGATGSSITTATSRLTIEIGNPGSATTITSIRLTGANLSSPITEWSMTSGTGGSLNFSAPSAANGANSLKPSGGTTFIFYPLANSSQTIAIGQTYNYVISFANGQSISGSLIAK